MFKYISQIWYCRVSIKSTPLRDCDTPDEIFGSSPYLEDCDKRKNFVKCGKFLTHFIDISSEISGGNKPSGWKLGIYQYYMGTKAKNTIYGQVSRSDLSSGPLRDPWQGPNFGTSGTLRDAWPTNWLKPYSTWGSLWPQLSYFKNISA